VGKFIAFLNNLVEEKHPNVLLKGLECAESILRLDSKTGRGRTIEISIADSAKDRSVGKIPVDTVAL
jgi:hypothetical protein